MSADRPTHLAPVPAADVDAQVPDVLLTAVVDLTGRYGSPPEVAAELYEQTRRTGDCHTAVVRLGEDALRSGYDLGRAIAARFYLSAKYIEIEVPAGTRHSYLADEVRRHVRLFCADHAQTMASLRTPG
jgi:hypothetical protein